jgi:hypothetical protein
MHAPEIPEKQMRNAKSTQGFFKMRAKRGSKAVTPAKKEQHPLRVLFFLHCEADFALRPPPTTSHSQKS